MKFVNENESLVKQAADLGKRDVKVVEDNTGKHVLVGTCLAYEDELYENISKIFDSLQESLGLKPDNEYVDNCDYKSELRDIVLKYVLHANNADIVYGSNEY